METTQFKALLQEKTEQMTEQIAAYLPKAEGYAAEIFEAMEYSVLNGGKRLRPLLILQTYLACGGSKEDENRLVLPFCAALEMIHSYSLVHDDLPAMDNDQYRRGKLTTHAKYGHAMGILAGDGLLNLAYETMLLAEGNSEREWQQIRHAERVLAKKAGAFGMVGGQVVDVQKTGQPLTEDELEFIYRLKTGALLEASMMIGAILAGAAEEQIAAVEQIAAKVGRAFQIQDDILDLTSTTEELGKPVHSDEKNEKTTYCTLKGLTAAADEVKQLSLAAVEEYDTLSCMKQGEEKEFLRALLLSLIARRK